MRNAFEAWAQRDGHIVRRREDKPEEYLVLETQRRWLIWQAALAYGKSAAAKTAAQKAAAKDQLAARAETISADQASIRNRVLNEVLAAFAGLDGTQGVDGIVKVIEGLKAKQAALETDQPRR
jgi:hypothetical protein